MKNVKFMLAAAGSALIFSLSPIAFAAQSGGWSGLISAASQPILPRISELKSDRFDHGRDSRLAWLQACVK